MEIVEEYFSKKFPKDNIDSLDIYYPKNWVIATAKSTHKLLIFDKDNLKLLKSFPEQEGQLKRPNGIRIVDDFCFVVERDNKRIQVFELPSFKYVSSYKGVLSRPYGISIHKNDYNDYIVFVTDNKLTKSVIYKFRFFNNKFELIMPIKNKVLTNTESICCKYPHFYVADEFTKKVWRFDFDGRNKKLIFNKFKNDPEGIDIYEDYLILTDQSKKVKENRFHVFQREKHLGYFTGIITKNTDGIKISNDGFLFAVDDDERICCINFEKNWKSRPFILFEQIKQFFNPV